MGPPWLSLCDRLSLLRLDYKGRDTRLACAFLISCSEASQLRYVEAHEPGAGLLLANSWQGAEARVQPPWEMDLASDFMMS